VSLLLFPCSQVICATLSLLLSLLSPFFYFFFSLLLFFFPSLLDCFRRPFSFRVLRMWPRDRFDSTYFEKQNNMKSLLPADVGLSSLTVLQSLESLYIGECGSSLFLFSFFSCNHSLCFLWWLTLAELLVTREGLRALPSFPLLATLNIAGPCCVECFWMRACVCCCRNTLNVKLGSPSLQDDALEEAIHFASEF